MSTPNMTGPQGQGGLWMGYPPHGHPTPPPQPVPAQPASPDDGLLQTRPMGRESCYCVFLHLLQHVSKLMLIFLHSQGALRV